MSYVDETLRHGELIVLRSRVHILAYIPAVTILLLTMMPMGLSALASTELAITNTRIIGRMRKQRLTIPFQDIESVRVRRGLLGLFFNYGNVTINGNGIRVRFPGITKPKNMKQLIDNAVERTLFPEYANEKIPTSIPKTLPKAEPKLTPIIEKTTPQAPAFTSPQPPQDTPTPAIYKDPNAW